MNCNSYFKQNAGLLGKPVRQKLTFSWKKAQPPVGTMRDASCPRAKSVMGTLQPTSPYPFWQVHTRESTGTDLAAAKTAPPVSPRPPVHGHSDRQGDTGPVCGPIHHRQRSVGLIWGLIWGQSQHISCTCAAACAAAARAGRAALRHIRAAVQGVVAADARGVAAPCGVAQPGGRQKGRRRRCAAAMAGALRPRLIAHPQQRRGTGQLRMTRHLCRTCRASYEQHVVIAGFSTLLASQRCCIFDAAGFPTMLAFR